MQDWSIEEFAEVHGLSPRTVRHMCKGYQSNNGKYSAHLPEGYDCAPDASFKGGYRIFRRSFTRRRRTNKSPETFDELVRQVINLLPNKEDWLRSAFMETWMGGWGAKVEDPDRLFSLLEQGFWLATTFSKDVEISLTFQRTGNWGVSVTSKNAVSLAFTELTRDEIGTIERLYINVWLDKVAAIRNCRLGEKPKPPGGMSPNSSAWKYFRMHCLGCGLKLDPRESSARTYFCSKSCQDTHHKFSKNQTGKNNAACFHEIVKRLKSRPRIKAVCKQYDFIED